MQFRLWISALTVIVTSAAHGQDLGRMSLDELTSVARGESRQAASAVQELILRREAEVLLSVATFEDASMLPRLQSMQGLGDLWKRDQLDHSSEVAGQAVDHLVEWLGHPNWYYRRTAGATLITIGTEPAIEAVESALADEANEWVRSALEARLAYHRGEPPAVTTDTPASRKIPWVRTVEAALEQAERENKLVLATVVPLSARRFAFGYDDAEAMWKGLEPHPWGDERASAIEAGLVKERMMMATLFSDAEIGRLVREHFVPVRIRLHQFYFDTDDAQLPAPDPLRRLGTVAATAAGPAIVFAKPNGELVHMCGKIGTFSVPMAAAMIRAVLAKTGVEAAGPAPVSEVWRLVRSGRDEAARKHIDALPAASRTPETDYLLGHLVAAQGQIERANALWQSVVDRDPEGTWGSRAAIRLSTTGGRLEEWETLTTFAFDPLASTTEARFEAEALDSVIERAALGLLRSQRANGAWLDPFVDPSPRSGAGSEYDRSVARTGLVVAALLEARSRVSGARIDAAIDRGAEYVGQFADDPEPFIWQLTYALHLQVALLRAERDVDAATRRAIRLVEALAASQHLGGWSYVRGPRVHSFNTALVLLLLTDLRELGVDVPPEMVTDAADLLEGLRSDGARENFYYATTIRYDAPRGSSCRTVLCELALKRQQRSESAAGVRAGVELFLKHESLVRATTKVYESTWSSVALHDSYHHFFGHYYTALGLVELPKAEARQHAEQQLELILGQVELDGSFVDGQMQGKSASTALAVLALCELAAAAEL